MAEVDIKITVTIPPKPKPSVGGTAGGHRFKETNAARWEYLINRRAEEEMPDAPLDGPMRVDILAVIARPQYMAKQYKRDNRKQGIKAGDYKYPVGLIWHESKPDEDNVRKAVKDGLASHWRDDCIVCYGATLKAYAEIGGKPRIVVRIRSLEEYSPEYVARRLGLL